MSEENTTTTETTTATPATDANGKPFVPGVEMVKVKVIGKPLDNGKRGKCIVNGYICLPGIIRRVPLEVAQKLEKLGYVSIEGV